MLTMSVLLLAVGTGAGSCPLDHLVAGRSLVAWGSFHVGAAVSEVERAVGSPLELRSDAESTSRHSDVVALGRPVVLHFHEVAGALVLTGLTIQAAETDEPECWSRESLVAQLHQRVPSARYSPSRHDADRAEARNEDPMYAVGGRNDCVVLLKPSQRTIYVGELERLD